VNTLSKFVVVDIENSVGYVTLNRPDRLNAWHTPMRNELKDMLVELDGASNVRAIVLTGAGDRAFCSGQDLAETEQLDAERSQEWLYEFEALYDLIRGIRKPLVAALNGIAAGSGYQVALLCDVRVAHPGVRIGQPEVKSGIPSVTGTWLTREMVGLSRATEIVLTGRMMGAEEAQHLGLIHHLVPESEVRPKAAELALQLASQPPGAFELTKGWIRQMTEAGFRESFRVAREIDRRAFASGEPQEMMRKFFADRASSRTI
jgi:enoyl-CoA hydratase